MSGEPAGEFVDSNVLIYAHDVTAGSKHEVAKQLLARLWAEERGCLSIQVLQEFVVNATRKVPKPIPVSIAEEAVTALSAWTVHSPEPADVVAALKRQASSVPGRGAPGAGEKSKKCDRELEVLRAGRASRARDRCFRALESVVERRTPLPAPPFSKKWVVPTSVGAKVSRNSPAAQLSRKTSDTSRIAFPKNVRHLKNCRDGGRDRPFDDAQGGSADSLWFPVRHGARYGCNR